jgi:hypothetical protein
VLFEIIGKYGNNDEETRPILKLTNTIECWYMFWFFVVVVVIYVAPGQLQHFSGT